jgi:chromosomal replication initiator protein
MQQIWSAALERLSGRLSPQNFDMWLRPIEFVGSNDGEVGSVIHVRAPNAYVRLWFESNFLDATISELRAVSGRDMALVFEPESSAPPRLPVEPALPPPTARTAAPDDDTITSDLPSATPAPEMPVARPPTPTPVVDPATTNEPEFLPPEPAQLNPRYTFDTFVAGPSNQLAFAASQAAASTYPPKYNPVFICGGVGLGKTHLLHAIGHLQLSIRPGAHIVYLSSERFMNEYVNAIRSGRMHEFRRRYREGIDVLLVDDVQFLAGKDGTQDEFFHTFNALHDGHKQIVLTADRKPHEISDIADRLRTRFAWGLLADIEPPELEVRIAILRKKASNESIILPDDVALYIASSIKSNVRELEGALIRLAAYASLSKRTIDLPFAQETLGGALTRPREHITVDTVIKAVASYYGVKPGDIKSPRRHKSVANPRAVAMYLARQHTKDSYPDLGRAFGGKHHTTVISAVEKIIEKIKEDPGLRGEVHAIEAQILK